MRIRVFAAAAFVAASSLLMTACSTGSAESTSSSHAAGADATQLLADYGLTGLDSRAVIESLDTTALAVRPSTLIASVRPDALLLSDDQGREVALPMPSDEVYLSVAPYASQTHDCHFHSLTTCVGELANADVTVRLTSDSGEVLLDEARRTYDNGFVGVWVPRGITGTLEVAHADGAGSVSVSTVNVDDPTCITTLQLT